MKNCKEQLLKLETKRKILNFISKLFLILTLVFFILLFVAAVKLTKTTVDIKAFITLAILFGCTCLSILIVVESNAYFSKKVMKTGAIDKAIKEAINTELPEAVKIKDELSKKELKATKLFYDFNEIEQKASYKGVYKNVSYQFTDLLLVETSYSNGRRNTRRVFDGIVYVLDYEKDKDDKMLIYQQKPYFTALKGYEKLETEIIDFNNIFETYSNNKSQAYYFLTPIVINNLLDIAKNYDGKINLAYMDGKVIVAISTDSKGTQTGEVKTNNKSYSMGVLSQSLIKRIEGYSFRYSCVHKLIDALELSKEKYTNQD